MIQLEVDVLDILKTLVKVWNIGIDAINRQLVSYQIFIVMNDVVNDSPVLHVRPVLMSCKALSSVLPAFIYINDLPMAIPLSLANIYPGVITVSNI